jgi:hypothetical protein
MSQRTRMFTVLGALAMSMMAATALLGWIEPPGPGLPHTDQLLSIQESARRIVGDVRPALVNVSQETTIEIAECAEESEGSPSGVDACDYVVTRAGELRVGTRGRLDNPQISDSALRIGLVSDWSRTPVTSVQWHALRSLLDELVNADFSTSKSIRLASTQSDRTNSGSVVQLAAWLGDNGWLPAIDTGPGL